jgi:CBS domain-containing protein
MVLYAKDIVEADFVLLPGETNALVAARIMKEKKHGFVIVTSDGRPIGMVTEWDYLSKIVAESKDASAVSLAEIMSGNLVTVDANQGIDVVSNLMAEKGIRRILVMDKNRLIGVITSKTILARLEEYVNKVSSQIARLQAPY